MGKIERQLKGHNQRGFSLIEFVLVIAILSTFATGINLFMNPIIDLMVRNNFAEGEASEARIALMGLLRETAQIKNPTSVITANANTLSFTDVSNNVVTYELNSGALECNDIRMAMGITALTFTYYDSSNNVITTPTVSPNETNIARIEISLSVSSGGNTKTFRSQVRPRNLY